MARLPTVAIIGRPNTGKSSLFNRIVGRRQAIVSDVPGTTRDRVCAKIEGSHLDYLLVDTGGMGGGSEDSDLEEDVSRQSELALENADMIVLTISSRDELTGPDYAVADHLRKNLPKHVPLLIAFTKCDNLDTIQEELPRAYELNLGCEVVPVSSPHNFGIEDLTDQIEEMLKGLNFERIEEDLSDKTPRVAIIGKPNVGKSSLINAFLSEEAQKSSGVIVSDIPGTTRDSVDTRIGYEGKQYVFVDTAGLKRKMGQEELEKFASFRTLQALQDCDVAILVIDASKEIARQDKRIATLALEEGKGLVILLNKIDLLSEEQREELIDYTRRELNFCEFAPILPASAESKKNIVKLFNLIDMAQENRTRRITTKDLHNWYTEAISKHAMGAISRKHITQAEDIPPTFVLFVRDPKNVQLSQLKYLDRRLRESFGFDGTPVRWITKTA